jgi:2-polyprenyl-3-methyl-5-hydroxy-6-metoxy-1,4-benzoquinol methylase
MYPEYKLRTSCAICKNLELKTIFDFDEISLAGNFPKKDELNHCKKYPLKLKYCTNCSLVQTDSIINSDFLFKDYRYMSSIGLSKHFSSVAMLYKEKFGLNNNSKVLEIGSNDGVLLKPFMDLGIPCMGFDPSINISKVAQEKGCNVIVDYFSKTTATKYLKENDYDIICSNNCFAHIDDIHSILEGVSYSLKPDGHFIIEVHYLKNLIEQLQYDFVYHEHLYYYSLSALNYLFNLHGLSIVDFEEISIHSGSIRVYASKNKKTNEKVDNQLNFEKNIGMTNFEYFENYSLKVKNHIISLQNIIKNLKNEGFTIAGYGASGRGNVLLNMCKFTSNDISFIIDESPERYDRYVGGTDIPIFNKNYLNLNKPNYILILAWNYSDMIMEKLKSENFKYIIPFPTVKIHCIP